MTELEKLKVLSALQLGYGKLTARNTTEAEFKNIEEAIEIVKNFYITDVVEQSELLVCEICELNKVENEGDWCDKCLEDDTW